jgi:hypothetical protein
MDKQYGGTDYYFIIAIFHCWISRFFILFSFYPLSIKYRITPYPVGNKNLFLSSNVFRSFRFYQSCGSRNVNMAQDKKISCFEELP